MSIRATCGECGHEHTVSDELAGKKFRCKGCSEPVNVPAARTAAAPARKPSPPAPPAGSRPKTTLSSAKPLRPTRKKSDDDEFDFGDLPASQGETIEEEEPAPVAKPKKKKKVRSSSSGGGSGLATSGMGAGGVILFCVILRIVLKVLPAGALAIGGTASWRVWNHPTDRYSVEMPGAPSMQFKNGANVHVSEVRNKFACGASAIPTALNFQGMTPDQIADTIAGADLATLAGPGQTVLSKQRTQLHGHPAVEMTMKVNSLTNTTQMIILPDRLIGLEFIYDKQDYPTERQRFFGSLKIQ